MYNDGDIGNDELSYDALDEAYKMLHLKWNEECKASEKQKGKIEIML